MSNTILSYISTLQYLENQFTEDTVAELSNTYDDGNDYSIAESKEVIENQLTGFIQEAEKALVIANQMKVDVRTLSKKKFLEKYSC